jgi:glucose-6-phosphate 1-dehydrogenase
MMKSIMAEWTEEEIYRIDHFLGEEMVRCITHLRFANEHLIEPLLSKDRVAAVKIEMLEEFGCDGRGGYFDEFGMIRDVQQNRESTGMPR